MGNSYCPDNLDECFNFLKLLSFFNFTLNEATVHKDTEAFSVGTIGSDV